MSELVIYAAGEVHSDWRDTLRSALATRGLDVEVVGPREEHDRSDSIGEDILGEQPSSAYRDLMGARVNGLRTRVWLGRADLVVAYFGPKYRQWNTATDAGWALAEVASFLVELTPIPGPRQISVTRLAVSTSHTLQLVRTDLATLGVDLARYGERDYGRTQEIGAALVFLGFDGLIAPSARWPCDNQMIFGDNHALAETLEPIGAETVEWREWALAHGILSAAQD